MRLNLPKSVLDGLQARPAAAIRDGQRLPELGGPVVIVPAEVAIYSDGQQDATVIEGSAEIDADGNATVVVDVGQVPRTGNPIQIVIQPYPDMDPIHISGWIRPGRGEVPLEIEVIPDVPRN